jgi:hypothetical protein
MRNQLSQIVGSGLVLSLLVLAGCAYVRSEPVGNTPKAGEATLSGSPGETLRHFEEVYPAKDWPPRNARYRAVVCPLLVSREAIVVLAGESAQQVIAHAEAGNSKVSALVQGPGQQAQLFMAETLSDKAQAVLMEALLGKGPFELRHTSRSGFSSEQFFKEQATQGVPLSIIGNVDAQAQGAKEVRAFLRVIENETGMVRCAVSSTGTTLDAAVRSAAARLLSSFNRQT